MLAQGAPTADNTPRIEGTIGAPLPQGQVVRVFRNGTGLATAIVNGTTWVFDDTVTAPVNATQTYTARVEATPLAGQPSNAASVLIDTVAPAAANVTNIFDDAIGNVPQTGGFTTDSTPRIDGTLTTALNSVVGASTETLQVLRNNVPLVAAISFPTTTTWSITDPGPMTALTTYTYSARVVDAAGNQSPAGATRAATYDSTTRTASVALATNIGNGATIAQGAFTSATSIRLSGSVVNGPLLTGQTVRVLRNTTPLVPGIATVTGSAWTFDDTSPPNGALSYTVRIESSGSTGSPSPAYAFTVDNIRPAQTFAISATSDVIPFSTLSGAIPPDNNIPAGGTTNDPRPTVRVQLSSALAAGETLVVRRVLNGSAITDISPPQSSCGTNCIQFTESSDVVSIPVPATAPNSALPGSGAVQYRVSVRDAAANETLTPGTFSFTFDYFTCSQVRATNTAFNATPSTTHTTISFAGNNTANCSGCHGTFVAGATAAGTFVPVPRTTATYWCRRPP